MNTHAQIYEFASSVGSFEGYVYKKISTDELDMDALLSWTNNIVAAYQLIPEAILQQIQPLCDQTVGRAVKSLLPVLNESHEIIKKLGTMIVGEVPKHPDDFKKTKWFENEN